MIAWMDRYHGRYSGTKTLYAPEDPDGPATCEATLELEPYANGLFHGLRYRWSYPAGVTPQDGLLIVGERDGRAFGLWIDSWHNGRDVMRLEGLEPAAEDEPGAATQTRVKLRGTFSVPEGPDWGWTVTVEGRGVDLAIVMDVVPPGGEPARAVEGSFARTD